MHEPKTPNTNPHDSRVLSHRQCLIASIKTRPMLQILKMAPIGPHGPFAYALVMPTIPTVSRELAMKPIQKR